LDFRFHDGGVFFPLAPPSGQAEQSRFPPGQNLHRFSIVHVWQVHYPEQACVMWFFVGFLFVKKWNFFNFLKLVTSCKKTKKMQNCTF